MQIGLLWFDSDPGRTLAAKIEDAARHYREKFGVSPNTCYVNNAALNDAILATLSQQSPGGVLRIVPASNILPNHFWVGIENSEVTAQRLTHVSG